MLDRAYLAFRNRLAILRSIDKHELEQAGIALEPGEWERFRDNPERFFLCLGDRRARPLWALIETRMTEELREPATAYLQLRWAHSTDEERAQAQREGWITSIGLWVCHYEMVLPLREHDSRRDDVSGKVVGNQFVVGISKTFRASSREPTDAPFRDGAHASWDAEALGGTVPVYVIDLKGERRLEKPLRAGAAK